MTSDEVRRITERRNEAAAAMDACELEEAHRDTDSEGSSYIDHLECEQHLSRADYVLRIGGVLIPLCQSCIDELYEEILPQVSAEVRDKSK